LFQVRRHLSVMDNQRLTDLQTIVSMTPISGEGVGITKGTWNNSKVIHQHSWTTVSPTYMYIQCTNEQGTAPCRVDSIFLYFMQYSFIPSIDIFKPKISAMVYPVHIYIIQCTYTYMYNIL